MKSSYRIIVIITSLLLVLSISTSIGNYMVSLNTAQSQLKNQSLPLSLDNINSDIQKHVIEPYLVSSMMATDTFVQDWIKNDEKNQHKIQNYLDAVKNKYKLFNTFLVSNETKNYYTQNGFIEKVKKGNKNNKWYFDFTNNEKYHEINLDFNTNLSNELIMFINYKIFDKEFHFLGVTGVAIKVGYIDDMLKKFKNKHKLKVVFYNKNGDVVLAQRGSNNILSIKDDKYLSKYQDILISKKTNIIEYKKDDELHIISTKYIPELDLYLSVEASLDDFTKDVEKIFYFNLLVSLVMTIAIALVIYLVIKNYSQKLERLSNYDDLTQISNRRDFENKFSILVSLQQRKKQKLSLAFLDVDNFKTINDNLGHHVGDMVLKRVAKILKNSIRETDLLARWGGEEFIIVLIDSDHVGSIKVIELLRKAIESDLELKEIVGYSITASFGLTSWKDGDTQNKIITRADDAMYKSKHNGKNQVTTV